MWREIRNRKESVLLYRISDQNILYGRITSEIEMYTKKRLFHKIF